MLRLKHWCQYFDWLLLYLRRGNLTALTHIHLQEYLTYLTHLVLIIVQLLDGAALWTCDLGELLVGLHVSDFLELIHPVPLLDVQLLDPALFDFLSQVRQGKPQQGKGGPIE